MANYQVRTDLYPVIVRVDPGTEQEQVFDKARIVITLDHLYIFQDDQPVPSIVFEDRLTSYTPPVPATRVRKASQLLDRSAKFETEDGHQGVFMKHGGCGCGSRLKNMSLSTLLPESPLDQAVSTNDS